MKLALKELRESLISLKIIKLRGYIAGSRSDAILQENHELISIFVAGIQTAKSNLDKGMSFQITNLTSKALHHSIFNIQYSLRYLVHYENCRRMCQPDSSRLEKQYFQYHFCY